MKKSTIKLLNLINEIGDLKNIDPYKYEDITSLYSEFDTEIGDSIKVICQKWPAEIISDLTFPPSLNKPNKTNRFYNIEYTVNENEAQYRKSDFSYLMRILKTVSEIIKEIILKNDKHSWENENNIYTIFATLKFGALHPDRQKNLIYAAIAKSNMLPEYKTNEISFLGKTGIAITKIK